MLDKGCYRALCRGRGIAPEIQHQHGGSSNMKQNDNAFLGLGVKFPTLIDAPGVAPWNPNQLDIWAAEANADVNAVHSARFLLILWMPTQEWQCGRFDVNDALHSWDRAHRRVFLEWAANEEYSN